MIAAPDRPPTDRSAGRTARRVAPRTAATTIRRAAALAAVLALAASGPAGPAPAVPGPVAPAEPLPAPGAAVERALAAGETHVYTVDLAAGDFLRAFVEQRGIDLVLHLDTGGVRQLTGDSPHDGPEPLSWIATAAGEHRLAIVAAAGPGAGGYLLRVEAVRPAAPADRLLVDAERAEYRAAVATWVEGTAESRRRAVGEYEAALAMWRELGDRHREAAALSELGRVHRLLGDAERELARGEEAYELWRALGNAAEVAREANNLGTAHLRAGRWAEALDWLAQGREGFHAVGLAVDEGIAACNLGEAHRRRGEGDAARRLLEEGLALVRAAGARAEEANCRIRLGLLADREGEWERAIEHYRRALELAEAEGHAVRRTAALNNLGAVYEDQGRYHEALELYQQVLEIDRGRNRRGEAAALHNIGSIYQALGRRREAEEHYRRALTAYRDAGDRVAVARTLRNLGRSALRAGRAEEAAAPLEEAGALAAQLDNPPLAAELAIDLAELALARRDPAGAAAHAARAAELARTTGQLPLEAAALQQAGRAAGAAGDLAAAEARLGEALALWRRTGRPLGEAEALEHLAGVARRRDDFDLARAHLEDGLALLEGLRRTVAVDELRSSFFAGRHRVFEAHVDLLMELDRRRPGEGWAARALAASEAGRARNLLDLLERAEVDVAAGAPPDLVARHAEARHRLNALERRRLELAASGEPGEELAAIAGRIAETRWQAAWLEGQVLHANPRAGELLAAAPPGIDEVRALLAPDDLLLELALGEERSFLWAAGAAELETVTLPGRERLETLARAAYGALSSAAADPDGEAALAELGRLLLAPLARRLAGRRLLVVPDGALHYLPFAAFPDPAAPAGAPRPLVDGHEIVQLPSAGVLVHLARAAPPPPGRRTLAVLADPVFDARDGRLGDGTAVADALRGGGVQLDFQRLHFSRLEAEGLSRLVAPEERWVALGLDASRDALLAAPLDRFRFLHFATHGVLDAEIPELSGLVLSLVDARGAPREGFLRLHDVYRLRLAADLVTLSACRTALGGELRGEGLVGLTRGFLHAGARAVVASLWDVQDRATARLMERFYAGMLADGLAPAAALRAAQAELAADPRWRDPYYWAGFVLQGAPAAASPSPPERAARVP